MLIGWSQSTYFDKLLKWCNMHETKKTFLPMSHGICHSKTQSYLDKILHASAIALIMYVMLCTRLDVQSFTNRYPTDPGESYQTMIQNILKYLRGTKDIFLVYESEKGIGAKVHADASFPADKDYYRVVFIS